MLTKSASERSFVINRNSTLKLEGKTNVNSFTCDCTESFEPQTYRVERTTNSGLTTHFSRTKLDLRVNSLDCGNRMMNNDLRKALNAERHPNITIELLQVKEDNCNKLTELKDWIKLKALLRLTINGQSQDSWLDVTANKITGTRYRFIGSKRICMSDFGVVPPTALLGTVKVQDEIKISLDLEVSIDYQ